MLENVIDRGNLVADDAPTVKWRYRILFIPPFINITRKYPTQHQLPHDTPNSSVLSLYIIIPLLPPCSLPPNIENLSFLYP